MRVKMLSNIAGTPPYRDGQIVEMEARIARAWAAENPPLCLISDDPQDVELPATPGARER
jgi:hypothetical protein